MTSSPARRLIVAYAATTALMYLYVLIPGDSWYGDTSKSGLFWVAVNGFLVWKLWQGSAAAWIFALVLNLLGLLSITFIGTDLELASILILSNGAVVDPRLPAGTSARLGATRAENGGKLGL